MHPRPLQFAQSGSLVCGMSGLLRRHESGTHDPHCLVAVRLQAVGGEVARPEPDRVVRVERRQHLRVGRLLLREVIPRRLPARDVCTSLALGEAVVVDRFLLEGVPVALVLARGALESGLGECVGGHRCAFLYLRTVVSLMPVPRLLSRAYCVSASAMSWCAYVHSPRMFALSHMRAVVASSGWQSSMCARTASVLLAFTVGVRVGRLIRRPLRWGRMWCGRW